MAGEKIANKNIGEIKTSAKNSDGKFGKRKVEQVPLFLQSESERITEGPNNSFIVLGRDRNGSHINGSFGNKGYTQCGMIDLVAGRAPGLSVNIIKKDPKDLNSESEYLYVNPDFENDAARVYISQKTDIDAYLGIKNQRANAIVGFQSLEPDLSFGKSSVAIISDQTRICGRENVKIFTKYFSSNSLLGEVTPGGIELIAGGIVDNSQFSLQPMVKGDNLSDALTDIVDYIGSIAKVLENFMKGQMNFNDIVVNHTHIVNIEPPITEPPVTQDIVKMNQAQMDIYSTPSQQAKKAVAEYTIYLNGEYLTENGNRYIKSIYNKVN